MGWDGQRWPARASVGRSAAGRSATGRLAGGARAGGGDVLRDEVTLLVVAFGCAVFLLLGIVAPRELARTTWEHSGGTRTNDSPAGYVGLVSLCGIAALAALAVGVVARRWAVAAAVAALVATAAFGYGAYVVGNYWLGLAWGVVGLEGRADSTMRPPEYTVHWPLLLPVFALAALAGFVSALALAVSRLRHPAGN